MNIAKKYKLDYLHHQLAELAKDENHDPLLYLDLFRQVIEVEIATNKVITDNSPAKIDSFVAGWNQCKCAILELLKQPIQNCDLSWEEIDSRFLEKIREQI